MPSASPGPNTQPKLGIIAGGGPFPIYVVRRCREAGHPFFVLGLRGSADPRDFADVPHAIVRPGAGAEALRLLREAEVRDVMMIGIVERPSVGTFWPDWTATKWILRAGIKVLWGNDEHILKSLVGLVRSLGFRVVSVEEVIEDVLAPEGAFGSLAPDAAARVDIEQGIAAARAVGATDRGQGAVVAGGQILGEEDRHGTDALIARVAREHGSGSGGVLVKVTKPGQQRKIDLPTIGVATVEKAHKAGLRGIAVEAGGAIVVDRDAVADAADRAGLFVVGVAVDVVDATSGADVDVDPT